jgi:DNA polymerase-3 subunit delta'
MSQASDRSLPVARCSLPAAAIIGHQEAVAALNRSLADGRLAHAYLFAGPTGVGKATLALELAKALNCRAADAPCNACSVCRRIDAGKHPDVECIRPGGICDVSEHDHSADVNRDIRICQVRRTERVLGVAPYEGGRRVVILDPAEALNAQAADAFLKTLEEPPDGAVIVLVTANEGALSETIRSRCRRVPFRPLSSGEVQSALIERFAAPPARAVYLSRLFGGGIGRAVAALRDPDFDARRAVMLDQAQELVTSGLVDLFGAAERLADAYSRRERPKVDENGDPVAVSMAADGKPRTRADVLATLDLWIEWWRDLLLVAGDTDDQVVNIDRADTLREAAAQLSVGQAAAGVQALRDARRDLEQNVNPRLALEAMMLRLPRVGNRE